MRNRFSSMLLTLLVPLAVAALPNAAAAEEKHPVPFHLLSEHMKTLAELNSLAAEAGAVGVAAQHVLTVMAPHDRREETLVFPLIGLTDAVVDGQVGPQLAWALPMADQLVAERSRLYDEHTAIISAVTELKAAGEARNDAKVVGFAEDIAEDEVEDGELLYPQALLVGMVIRDKLAAK